MDATLTIIIPAFNEADSLPLVLPSLIKICETENWKILIVNDGSKDNTAKILESFRNNLCITIMHHKVNRGYGGALKTGIQHCTTPYCVTFDSDGQHPVDAIKPMLKKIIAKDIDLLVGCRIGDNTSGAYKETGKWIIRKIATLLMPVHIKDLNSGFKMYNTALAKKYTVICPNSMAFSDIITMIFISQYHLVSEHNIYVNKRIAGKSSIGLNTAFQTIIEIINIIMLFNPLKIFVSVAIFFGFITTLWAIPIFLKGSGLSVGALLGYLFAFFVFLLGLIAEQLGMVRKLIINKND